MTVHPNHWSKAILKAAHARHFKPTCILQWESTITTLVRSKAHNRLLCCLPGVIPRCTSRTVNGQSWIHDPCSRASLFLGYTSEKVILIIDFMMSKPAKTWSVESSDFLSSRKFRNVRKHYGDKYIWQTAAWRYYWYLDCQSDRQRRF